MLIHPEIDPIAIHRSAGGVLVSAHVSAAVRHLPSAATGAAATSLGSLRDLDDLLPYGIWCGARRRIGYCLFYKLGYYLANR